MDSSGNQQKIEKRTEHKTKGAGGETDIDPKETERTRTKPKRAGKQGERELNQISKQAHRLFEKEADRSQKAPKKSSRYRHPEERN